MAKENLETVLETEKIIVNCSNPACGRSYDLLKRKEQTQDISLPNSAVDYCSDRCWMENTSYEQDGIS